MTLSNHIAKHFREIYLGGNWTASNLKDQLEDVSWQEAITQIYDLNTIAALVYHIHYFVRAVTQVLQGGSLEAKDIYSFDHPAIQSATEWEEFLDSVWTEANTFIKLIEELPEEKLEDVFVLDKYGSYYRNLQGIIEHSHYHLGQIVLIKKIIKQQNP